MALASQDNSRAAAIVINGLTVAYGDTPVLKALNLTLRRGEVTALCGANGCGKSTLLKTCLGLLTPDAGEIHLDGRDLSSFSPRTLAREVALLPQHPVVPEGLTVAEVVALGRHPHRGWLTRATAADHRAITAAMEAAQVCALAQRRIETLSGGERQRVWLALTLAQESHILLLDEPTTFLDPQHQVAMLGLVRRIARSRGLTVVWVLHDLNHAAGWSDRIVLLRDGALAIEGTPQEVLTEANIQSAFGLNTLILAHPQTGHPLCVPRM